MEKKIIATMSGSSLDGIDVVYCKILNDSGKYSFEILEAECVSIPDFWIKKLRSAPALSGQELWHVHVDFGRFLGETVFNFRAKHRIDKVDFVASHGHTIFHCPEKKFTTQIGEGAALSAACGLPVVCDFRTTDVAHGGTGAPIVPIADVLLFPDFDFCLNLGGIANVTVKHKHGVVAFDVAPCNQLLDTFAREKGIPFDDRGKMAQKGNVNNALLKQLLQQNYHRIKFPKSLDNSYSKNLMAAFQKLSVEDKLRTAVEYIALAILNDWQQVIEKTGMNRNKGNLLITGGGAFNSFLVERIQSYLPVRVVIPNAVIVKFKEALAIALLGFLRWYHQPNVLASVTGASKNTINGAIYVG
jgi:anhydro-N-acetylmuramic acid kinase